MTILYIHLVAFIVSGCLWIMEKIYCGHRDWWWDEAALISWLLGLIPVLGILFCIAGSIDCIRNILKELGE